MKPRLVTADEPAIANEVKRDLLALIAESRPIRRDVPGGRLHIDRPLPFLCVYVGSSDTAAYDVASANASYLTTTDLATAAQISQLVADEMRSHCGAFLLIDVGELEKDRFLSDDAPFLPPFEISLAAGDSAGEQAALKRFSKAALGRKAKYRTPRIEALAKARNGEARLGQMVRDPCLTIRFAPIYRTPDGSGTFPTLRELMIANMLDSGLQAVGAFLDAEKIGAPATHRSLGRRAYIDAVIRADREMDKIASSFDFLLAVTPINAEAAWQEFKASGFEQAPNFLYRPLEFHIGAAKHRLYAIALDKLEDPLLAELYAEKRQELDLQLSIVEARETRRFVELGRALYGPVEASLSASARNILSKAKMPGSHDNQGAMLDCEAIAGIARDMIGGYRRIKPEFDASVEIRADIPAGLMVSGNRLLVSRASQVSPKRIKALLSHEIGVHLLTHFNGGAQGLDVLRTGLAGYEAMQEGLAVLAEYLVGGMSAKRLRLLAARVIGCEAMLAGASFAEAFAILQRDCGFDEHSSFHLALRIYRGGGLAKDAIYLRGLGQVLQHLKSGGSLTPFWMGKISAAHFEAMEELAARGLLRAPLLEPAFLASDAARSRLKKAMAGIEISEMVS